MACHSSSVLWIWAGAPPADAIATGGEKRKAVTSENLERKAGRKHKPEKSMRDGWVGSRSHREDYRIDRSRLQYGTLV